MNKYSNPIDLAEYQNGPNILTIKVSANLFFSFYLAIFIQNELALVKWHRSIRGLLIMSVVFFCFAVFLFGIESQPVIDDLEES